LKTFTKTLLSTALAATLVASTGVAAAQKIGKVDIAAVFQAVPQTAAIEPALTAEFKDQIALLEKLRGDVQFLVEKVQREGPTMSDDQKTKLQEEFNTKRSELEAKGKPLQQLQQRRLAEERNKVIALINQTVTTIAAEKDYDVVLEGNTVLYIAPEHDLSQAVIEKVSKIK